MSDDKSMNTEHLPMGLSIVIPVYHSSAVLNDLIASLVAELSNKKDTFEIILVNDGSPDNSWDIIQENAKQFACVRGIKLIQNFGQHNALLCGLRASKYAITITMDDDLQHSPKDIHVLVGKLRDGFDVIYGTPMDEQHNLWRDALSRITKIVMQISMGVRMATKVSAFRAFRTELRAAFSTYSSPYVSLDVLLTWATSNFGSIAVEHQPRSVGKSNYTVGKLIKHALNMITGFSVLPLRVASIFGLIFGSMGFILLAYVTLRYLVQGSVVPGFPFLASLISLFSGIQLLSLGIIGEYMARIHFRTMDRPPYIIREEID